MGVYSIEKKGDDNYHLYHLSEFLLSFSRSSFQADLIAFVDNSDCYSRNWIGSILRIFNKQHPAPKPVYVGVSSDERLFSYPDNYLVDYLKSKGFRVVRNLNVPDVDVVKHLESRGYFVEGLLNDCFYSSSLGAVNGQ